MCKFFSLVSNGKGTIYYFDWEQRQKILNNELQCFNHNISDADSHSSIIEYLREKRNYLKNDFDEKFNKYEYNPITKEFTIDTINVNDDSNEVKEKCLKLDFSKIVKELIIHDIIHPFKNKKALKVNEKDIQLLKKWHFVWDSIVGSVWDSVCDSVWDYVWDSIVGSVWDSVCASVRDYVRASVCDSVWDSVCDSVWDSVGAYISSYFQLEKWKHIKHRKSSNPFQPCIDLWNKGIVPSFDGKIWRLHGHEGKIIWEDKKHIINKGKINDSKMQMRK